ncbi:MAG: outer membrane protein assembly factor BamE [Gammaproteobacteria bacterium]|nr:outer membrane protein assembly factor BamE [Gammaproteobacteria bacterium]
MKSRLIIIFALLGMIVSFTGCLYRVDIHQGNRIDNKVIEQLELGMTRRQVEFLLGEPSVVDLYRPDVWHYVMYYKSGEDDSEQKRVLRLKFDNDLLSEINGDRNLVLDS